MGADLTIQFKKDKRKRDTKEIGMDRGFCRMIGDGRYGEKPVLMELSKIIEMDISFLLQPEYSDPEESVYWAELAGLERKGIKQERVRSNTFLTISSLYEKVKALIFRMKEVSDYHEKAPKGAGKGHFLLLCP